MKNLSLVLLRRLFTNDFDEMWAAMPVEHQAAVKSQLIDSIRTEREQTLRKKLCDAAAELCRNLIG